MLKEAFRHIATVWLILSPFTIYTIYKLQNEIKAFRADPRYNVCEEIEKQMPQSTLCRRIVKGWLQDTESWNGYLKMDLANGLEKADGIEIVKSGRSESNYVVFESLLSRLTETQLLDFRKTLNSKYGELLFPKGTQEMIEKRLTELKEIKIRRPGENIEEFVRRTQCI